MTLSELLEPTSTVIAHAAAKGLQGGAALGATFAIPALALSPARFNSSDEPPLVAAAKLAGGGAAAGAGLAAVIAISRLSSLDGAGIRERAEKLTNNEGLRSVRRASTTGAAVGLALVSVRVVRVAEDARVSVLDVALSREAAWEVFCFSAFGAAVGIVALKVGRLGVCAAGRVRARLEKNGAEEPAGEEVAAAAALLRKEAEAAVGEEVSEVASDAVVDNEESKVAPVEDTPKEEVVEEAADPSLSGVEAVAEAES